MKMQDIILTGYTPLPGREEGLDDGDMEKSEFWKSYAASRKAFSVASRISSGVNGLCK